MRASQADLGVTGAVAALACAAAAGGAPTAVTTVLGIALFAAPGYLLGRLLLGPGVAGLERVAVACGLAFVVPIVGGLLLYAAGVPLHRAAWLGLLAGVTLAGDLVLLRRRRSGRAAAFSWPPRGWHLPARHAAAFGAAVVVAACALGLARIGVTAQPNPGFTELWLSAREGHALTASLGVSNQQGATTRYRLVLLRAGGVSATWGFTLAKGQTWRRAVPFTDRYAMAANLYRLPDLARPYRHVGTAGGPVPGS
jgi:hypothetical protein